MHHGSARLTIHTRRELCRRVIEEGQTIVVASAALGVSRQTGSKWVARWRAEGDAGLENRSTRPHRTKRVGEALVLRIRELRLRDRLGPHRLSWLLGVARSTIYAVLRRLGLHRLSRLEPRPSVHRYEWPTPGDLLHLDTKKLGRIGLRMGKRFDPTQRGRRGEGWTVIHVAVDDHSRLAYAEELPDETPETAAAFTRRALAFYRSHGVSVRRILTDNGNPYRSRAFPRVLGELGVRHLRTRPYTPRTNGKAEALVKILLNGWAYARPYDSDADRSAALPGFMDFYNRWRPHGGLDGARPIDRVRQ
jgi:transposase InsO family protein